jgi:hypothetical protein
VNLLPTDPDLFIQKRAVDHPAIGLVVTVSGQHMYSGYHGTIREVLDDSEPGLFRVELGAKLTIEKIKGDNLSPRQ